MTSAVSMTSREDKESWNVETEYMFGTKSSGKTDHRCRCT